MAEFQRFTAPDAARLAEGIAAARERLALARRQGDAIGVVDGAADLGGLLTTARQEAEALAVLAPHAAVAESLPTQEPTGSFWCAYATALQYLDRRDETEALFAKTLQLCRDGGWQRLQAMAHQHWGRSLVEQGRLDEARTQFEAALALRQALGDPRQALSQAALDGLAELRDA